MDGKRFFAEGYRSSHLTIPEMTNLLESIFAEGTRQGIKFKKHDEMEAELGHVMTGEKL